MPNPWELNWNEGGPKPWELDWSKHEELSAKSKRAETPAEDIIRSVAAAPRKVAEGLVGLPGTLSQGLNKGIDYLLGTETPTTSRVLPTPEDIQAQTSKVLGPSYQAYTTAGRYVGSGAEGVVGAMIPGGGASMLTRALMGAGSGLGAEAGRQFLPNNPVIGPLAGGLAGGIGTTALGKGLEHLRNFSTAKAVGKDIGGVIGAGNIPAGAVRRVAKSAEEDQVTPATAIATQAQLGPDETMIMDLGRQLQGRAEQMAVQPGAAQNTVLGAVEGRTGVYGSGAAERIGKTLDESLGPSQDVVKLVDRVDQLVQSKAAPAYESVMNKYPNVAIPDEITSRPAVQHAMSQAEGIAANYGKKISATAPNLEYWDYVKKALDHRINGMMRSGIDDLSSVQKADLGGLIDAKQSLVSHLDNVTQGEYANARRIASTKPELHDALDFGRSIFNSNLLPEEVTAHIGDMSLPSQAMAQVGARRELERTLSNVRNQGAKARAFLDTNNNLAKISALFGPDAAKAIENRVAAENVFQQSTENIARNSRTAQRLELAKDTASPTPVDLNQTAFGTFIGAPIKSGLAYALQHGMEKTRGGIADILTAKGGQIPPIVEQLMRYNAARAAHETAPVGQQMSALVRSLMAQQAAGQ